MKKRGIILTTLPTLVSAFVLPTFVSCQDNSFPKKVDGTDWGGHVSGAFLPEDYLVDETTKNVTYRNGKNIEFFNLVIPNYVIINEQKYCVFIGSACFQNCEETISGCVEFNDFIDEIPSYCFDGDISITSLRFHTYPINIEDYAFSQCHIHDIYVNNLVDWTLKLRKIGNSAFEECRLTHPLILGPETEFIGNNAFVHNFEIPLASFTFAKKIKYLPVGMFQECSSLKTVTLHSQLTNIRDLCFNGCTGLDKIILPSNGMKLTLGQGAFNWCTNFTGFSKDYTLDTIGNDCFMHCTRLNEIMWDEKHGLEVVSESAFEGMEIATVAFYQNGVKDVLSKAFASNAVLLCIDLTDFKYPNVPHWSGTNIFVGAPEAGVILVDKTNQFNIAIRNLFYDPVSQTHIQGITFGKNHWELKVK